MTPSRGVLDNRATKFISDISLEIYLSHTLSIQLLKRVKANTLVKNDVLNLIILFILTVAITLAISIGFQWALNKIENFIKIQKAKKKSAES